MYLLTPSETLKSGVAVTFTAGTNTGNLIDSDLTTFSETADRDPNLTVDLGANKVIDALYLKGEHLQDYVLKASLNNITYTDIQTGVAVADGQHSFIIFTNTTGYRYWRLSFSERETSDPNYRVSQVYLCRLLLDLNSDKKRPYRYSHSEPRTEVVAYDLFNGQTIQYKTGNQAKVRLGFGWENLAVDTADALEDIWRGNHAALSGHAPDLTVYPRPNAEPALIYQMKWAEGYRFNFTGAHVNYGKRGEVVFEEI